MERDERKAFNEAVFREVNERVREVTETFSATPERESLPLVCECADASCVEQIELSHVQYERVRSEGTQFVIVSGHERADLEEVIEQVEGYAVVRKRAGAPAQLAEQTDPRG